MIVSQLAKDFSIKEGNIVLYQEKIPLDNFPFIKQSAAAKTLYDFDVVYYLFSDNECVSIVFVKFGKLDLLKYMTICTLETSIKHRLCGYGKKLVSFLINAYYRKVNYIECKSLDNAKAFYKKLRFVESRTNYFRYTYK